MRWVAVFLACLLAACASGVEPRARPALVVLIVVDGLPQRQLVDYRDQLVEGGLRRFLDQGRWFAEAHHGHALTVTAPGHAVMLTGAYPGRTGIIGNEWRDRATGELTSSTTDAAHTYIGHKTGKLDGTSPKNLRVETLGDVLERASPGSKVIAIAGKDRGAILTAGRTGTAYMYQAQTGRFASSTYYMKAHPAWVAAFDARKPADAWFHRQWRPLLPDSEYARSLPDDQPWYSPGGKLPKMMGEGQDAPGPSYYASLLISPFVDALTLDFARAAIAGEDLGADDSPDILVLCLSGHDYVNHYYGAESRLSHDHVLQLDRLLRDFFRDLDARVGRERYVAALSADHGFTPVPDHSRALGRDAGRVDLRRMLARVNSALEHELGDGAWLRFITYADLALDERVAARHGVGVQAALEAARKEVLKEPGIAAVYTRAQIEGLAARDAPYLEAVRRGWDRERSGDLQLVMKPYWVPGGGFTRGTTHGSPHRYDTHVPLAFYGPAWVSPGRVDAPVAIVDLAPTLAALLGISPPAASQGRPLPLGAR